ncbi:MAG: DUF1311 domain-containing protein [Clostridia bacterium]|nr:DUF1311 domain-containing protein [Clostridia bacterium]
MKVLKILSLLLCLALCTASFSGCCGIGGKLLSKPLSIIEDWISQEDAEEPEGEPEIIEAEGEDETASQSPEATEIPKAVPSQTSSIAEQKRNEYNARAEEIQRFEDDDSMTSADQATLNRHSYEVFQKWDVLLNDIYRYLKSTMSASEFKALEADEIRWINEKETAVKAAGAEFEGGSMRPLVENTTATSYTKERCYYLISLID